MSRALAEHERVEIEVIENGLLVIHRGSGLSRSSKFCKDFEEVLKEIEKMLTYEKGY